MADLTFDHYTMRVKDLDRSAAFYKEVLGLEEIENRTRKEHIRWFSLGRGELHLAQGPTVRTHVGIHLALALEDIEAFMDHLKSHDITIHDSKGTPEKITTRADGILQIYFKDPDGYWIEVNNAV